MGNTFKKNCRYWIDDNTRLRVLLKNRSKHKTTGDKTSIPALSPWQTSPYFSLYEYLYLCYTKICMRSDA